MREEHIDVQVNVQLADRAVIVCVDEFVVRVVAPFASITVDSFGERAFVELRHLQHVASVDVGRDGVVDLGADRVSVVDLPVYAACDVCAHTAPVVHYVAIVSI